MKIRMYNLGYGDGVCIRDRQKSLLVDFGTGNFRIAGYPRSEIFDVIISDLSTFRRKSLLLSNLHPENLSGFLYMMNKQKEALDFETVYLPDIFSSEQMNRTILLFILADLMKDSSLPGRQVSLVSLVDALSASGAKTKLLQRGSCFDEKYCALWPDPGLICRKTDEIFSRFSADKVSVPEELTAFSDGIRRRILSACTEKTGPDAESTGEHFRELRASGALNMLLSYCEDQQLDLKRFKSSCSIAFQNRTDGELNVLFTGDVCPEGMKMIAENYDSRIPLFEHYWCIKAPHHGTEDYYFDFSPYAPENLLISNGIHFNNNKKPSRELRTSSRYGGLFYLEDAHMYCTNTDCCDAYRNGCSCKEWDIVAPAYYKDL